MKIKHKIYKKKDKWILNYVHPTTNKRTRKTLLNKKQCLIHLEEIKNQYILDQDLIYSDKTLNDFTKEYISKYPGTQLISTQHVYYEFMASFGNMRPLKIQTDELKSWFENYKSLNRLSTKSISNYKAQLNTIFRYLEQQGYIKENLVCGRKSGGQHT